MPMTAAVLESGLTSMAPVDNEADAIQTLVNAWDGCFAQSQVGAAVAVPGSYAAGLSAMQSAMSGLSTENNAAAAIHSGFVAFWSAIASLATTIWITAPIVLVPPIVPPPGLGTIASDLPDLFELNTTQKRSLADCAHWVALVLYGANTAATVPGSIPPNPPAPLPIA